MLNNFIYKSIIMTSIIYLHYCTVFSQKKIVNSELTLDFLTHLFALLLAASLLLDSLNFCISSHCCFCLQFVSRLLDNSCLNCYASDVIPV